APSTQRSSWRAPSPPTGRWRSTPPRPSSSSSSTGARRSSGSARASCRARSSAPRTRARAPSPSRRSATPCGRAARSNLPGMSATAAALPAPATRPRREVRVVFAALMLAVLLAALDSTIVATALPTITAELGGLDQLSWVVTGYLLAPTTSRPAPLGRHRVPAGLADLDPALRQARRPLRAQADLPGRDRHLPRRLRAVRT